MGAGGGADGLQLKVLSRTPIQCTRYRKEQGNRAVEVFDPSRCNADGNGTGMVPSGGLSFGIEGANHCSFEDPTDGVCTTLCGGQTDNPDGIRTTLLGMTAGFVQWHGGIDERGEAWWTPGSDKFEDCAVDVTAK